MMRYEMKRNIKRLVSLLSTRRTNETRLSFADSVGVCLFFLCGVFLLGYSVPVVDAAHQDAEEDTRPLSEQPYLGCAVRDYPESNRAIVGWIYPGPMNGTGFVSDYLVRGDFILAVDDHEVHTRDEFKAVFLELSPGDMVRLTVMRTEPEGRPSVPTPGTGTEVETVEIMLACRADWTGPVAQVVPLEDRLDPDQVVPVETELTALERFINPHVDEQGLREPIDELTDYFVETLEKYYGANMPSRVAYGFQRPTRLAELQELITTPLGEVASQRDPSLVLVEAAKNLDVEYQAGGAETVDLSDPEQAIRSLDTLVTTAGHLVDQAFFKIDSEQLRTLPGTMSEMAQCVADNFYINEHSEVNRLIRALNSSTDIDFTALFDAAGTLSGLTLAGAAGPNADEVSLVPLPDGLTDAVSGEVLAVVHSGGRWYVYGGFGANEYDLSRIDVVIDAGGDDVYRYPAGDLPTVQVILDLNGNDQYIAVDDAVMGPACARLGVIVLVDHAGRDVYAGSSFSCGVALMGIGLLVDHGGADTYTGSQWSLGAAFYGVGAIVDLGNESDVYTAETFSQAIGGPRGFGLILEENGRDLYRANGPITSVYGTDAVYAGISQGVGFGVRGYETGGIGVLCDLNGHDRYEAGEFSQGGAYYWGLGVLYDRNGRDLYYGNRYGQAFAAHQALGILADDDGDDTYWGMTAATQSGSWDICATLLIDRGGNDSYQADGLAQGGASQQAIAWLVDLDGVDRYSAPGGSTQGQSGGNTYHYDASKCFSWSMFLDAGGDTDVYSRSDRGNDMVISTGEMNEEQPKNSGLHGLFLDVSSAVE